MSIQALREQLSLKNRETKALLAEKGDRTWTKADQDKFDSLMEDAEGLSKQIDNHKRVLDAEAEASYSDVKKIEPDSPKTQAKQGFDVFLRKMARDYTDQERLAVRNVMSTTTGSEGGFSVQPIVAADLINMLKSYAFMRQVCGQITTSNGADLSYPTTDGTTEVGDWVAQNVQAATLDLSFGTRALNTFKAGSRIIPVPIELLQDSQIDVQALVLGRMRDRIGRLSNIGYTVGTNVGQPNGLVTASPTGKIGLAGQTTTIIYEDLADMVDSLDAAYLGHPMATPSLPKAAPGWMFSQTLRRSLRKLKDSTGRPIWTPGYEAGITEGAPDYLMGFPVYLNNDMPVPAANAKSLAFGNYSRYLIRDAMDVTIFRFDDSPFMSKGQVGFLAWARTGGNLMDINSVRVYQHSAT